MAVTDLAPEVHDLAIALGVLAGGRSLQPGFFADPLGEAAGMLHDPARRAALGDLIDALVPPDTAAPTGPDPTETWHLLSEAGPAKVHLTVRPTGAGMVLGLGLRVASEPSATAAGAAVALTVATGLVEAGDAGLRTVVGTADGPVRARLEVTADPDQADFASIALDAALTPADADRPVAVTVTVTGLRVDGTAVPTITVDPTRLGRDAIPLLQGLLEQRLGGLATRADLPAPLAALAEHLLPLLGLSGDTPRLPVDRIGHDPTVVGQWFASVLDAVPAGGGAPGSAWLAHLAGLLGSDTRPAGSGTEADPWRVPVASIGDDRVELTLATRTTAAGRDLLVGAEVALTGPGGLVADDGATLVALPLSGSGAPTAVPAAAVVVRAPGDPGATLVDADGFKVGFARGGFRWDGTDLRPVLDLGAVTFEGHTYDLLDLSHVDSVTAAAAAAVRAALVDALGADGPGARLAVLLGLAAPDGETGAPLADPVALLTGPTRELARVHRARLAGTDHPWAPMLAELAGLLGATDPVAGTGTVADPWRVSLARVGPVTLALTAWRGTPEPQLHLGLRASGSTGAGAATVAGALDAEIVALAFP